MRTFAILVVLCLTSCAGLPLTPAKPATHQAWTDRDVSRFQARCTAGFELPSPELTAVFCTCMGEHMRVVFGAEWLTDGRAIAASEKRQLDRMVDACLAELSPDAI
jgi:hypothetical protein